MQSKDLIDGMVLVNRLAKDDDPAKYCAYVGKEDNTIIVMYLDHGHFAIKGLADGPIFERWVEPADQSDPKAIRYARMFNALGERSRFSPVARKNQKNRRK